MAQQGVDLRVRHTGAASPLEIPEAQLAWLAAHSPWRSGVLRAVRFADLWDGPEPAPGLPEAPERAVVAVADPSDIRRVRAAWPNPEPGEEPLVVAVAGHAPDAADAVADLVVADAMSAAAEAWVVVADEASPLGAAAVALGRPLLRRGPALAARLAAALAGCDAPPQAVGVAALAVGRARRRPARPDAHPVAGTTVVGDDHPASSEGLLTAAVREALHGVTGDGTALWLESARTPRFARPVPGRSAVMWHWPFATPPREWVHAAQVSCDEVWVGSRAARAHLARAGVPAGRVHVIPTAVDTSVFTPAGTRDGDHDDVRLVFTGDLTVRDGADLLLAAAARAFGSEHRVTLVLAPARTEPALVERANALALRDDATAVRWERADTARELADVLHGCHAAVHPAAARP
ncbi:MAG: hypothetical protein U0Y82_07240 [Thermoleophilia bacterium]